MDCLWLLGGTPVLDQPEDDLDTRMIMSLIVEQVRSIAFRKRFDQMGREEI
jgi:hypothetical protein